MSRKQNKSNTDKAGTQTTGLQWNETWAANL